MLKMVSKKNNSYGVLNTEDDTVEYYSEQDLIDVIESCRNISGVFKCDGNYIFRVYDDLDPMQYAAKRICLEKDVSIVIFDENETRDSARDKVRHMQHDKRYVVINNSNLKVLNELFMSCNAKELDLSHFDTSKVTNMSSMFLDCRSKLIDFRNFDTSNVSSMSDMFRSCQCEFLDLSTFDTSRCVYMIEMFYAYKGDFINLSSFDTSKVKTMCRIFMHSETEVVDVRNFLVNRNAGIEDMFTDCLAKRIFVRRFPRDLREILRDAGLFNAMVLVD